ncbi:5'-deoxynucleotidase [Vibrio hepatarius]|uniref:5'-deoxynucleotidase n=1 Tax=Vibrio hepatarius TaxID=171383 RepID=UPI001C08B027|nr:5'-deoxynucleotidase [Vibrio hepatarius]MBU2895704.1 5'-deoxynucleotidase [Vibrio hepatarius]
MKNIIKYAFSKNALFALIRRTRYINRWSLMFNVSKENVGEHSHEVAIFSHGMAVIGVNHYNRDYNAERIGIIAIYHELSESVLGDQPSTLKHATEDTTSFFKGIESEVEKDIVASLPDTLQSHMESLTLASHFKEHEKEIVKAADLLSMLIKCDHELSLSNREFTSARKKVWKKFEVYLKKYPEVQEFYEIHMGQSQQTIDGLVNL